MPKKLSEVIRFGAIDALEKIGLFIQGEAKKNAPADTGLLRKKIFKYVDKLKFYVEIGSNLFYAKYVEFGFRPHFVPFKDNPAFKKWAERHGIPTEYVTLKGEKKLRGGLPVGIEPVPTSPQDPTPVAKKKPTGYSPFLRKAVWENRIAIERLFTNVMRRHLQNITPVKKEIK